MQLLMQHEERSLIREVNMSNKDNNTKQEIVVRTGIVNAELLNCRIKPDINSELHSMGPLTKGTTVTILSENEKWLRIKAPTGTCFVMKEFVTTE